MDAGKNIGKAFSTGFHMPGDIASGNFKAMAEGLPNHFGSIGGLMTVGGGTLAGAAAGAGFSSLTDSGDPMKGAAIGAAIGTATIPAIGLASAGVYGIGKAAINNSGAIASEVLGGIYGAGKIVDSVLGSKYVNKQLSSAGKVLGNMFEYSPSRIVTDAAKKTIEEVPGKFKLKPLGWGMAGAGIAIKGTMGAVNEADRIHRGAVDNYVTSATPRIPSYANNAGATGDLVFALNNNRRG